MFSQILVRSTQAAKHNAFTIKLWLVFCGIAALLWTLALAQILHTLAVGGGFPLGSKFPAFEDIIIYQARFQTLHTTDFFVRVLNSPRFAYPPAAFAYPPAAAMVYVAFYVFAQPEIVFTICIALWTAFLCLTVWRFLRTYIKSSREKSLYLWTLPLFSFPLIFLADRSNIELFVWALMFAATCLYLRDHSMAAAVCIGLAASLKLYPILLLGLFLAQRPRLRPIIAGIAVCVGFTLVAVWYSGPSFLFALHGFWDGVLRFNTEHAEAARATEAVFDHSFLAPWKVYQLHSGTPPTHGHGAYYAIASVTMLALFVLRVRSLPVLNRLVFLTGAMISLPPVSYEYTLVHLYLPLLLLGIGLASISRNGEPKPASQLAALGCLLFLMFPLGLLGGGSFQFAGQLQALGLLLLIVLSAISPWHMAQPLESGLPPTRAADALRSLAEPALLPPATLHLRVPTS